VAALAGSRAGWERTACFAAAARVAGSVGPVETAGLPRRSSCPCTGRSRDRACTSWTSWRSLRESWVVGVFETAVSYVGILVAIGEVRGAENSGLQMLWLGDGWSHTGLSNIATRHLAQWSTVSKDHRRLWRVGCPVRSWSR